MKKRITKRIWVKFYDLLGDFYNSDSGIFTIHHFGILNGFEIALCSANFDTLQMSDIIAKLEL